MLRIIQNNILSRSFYARDTVIVAHDLIGHILVRNLEDKVVAGIITETEAYRGDDDPACHAYRGKTNRTAPLFGTPGLAYIYFIYGVHYCFNIVAKLPTQKAGGVLIRALKPIEGIEHMKKWRGISDETNLSNGPGKLAQALQITKIQNSVDCTQVGEIYVIQNEYPKVIQQTPRIGISQGQDTLWRFVVKNK